MENRVDAGVGIKVGDPAVVRRRGHQSRAKKHAGEGHRTKKPLDVYRLS